MLPPHPVPDRALLRGDFKSGEVGIFDREKQYLPSGLGITPEKDRDWNINSKGNFDHRPELEKGTGAIESERLYASIRGDWSSLDKHTLTNKATARRYQ
jgi:hypothetical protein